VSTAGSEAECLTAPAPPTARVSGRLAAARPGSGHKAGLNFGDCFAYALAKTAGEALLFKGDDFGHTDITPALPRA
jgi:uncharacterized protein with PIN domain